MVAPDTWGTPTSGAAITGVPPAFNSVFHAGDYWFNFVRDSTVGTAFYLRYASDPTGAWSTATFPAWPTGTTFVTPNSASGVYHDGTHYAINLRVGGTAGSRIYYASNPSSWSEHDTALEPTYRTNALIYDGSRWVIAGSYFGGTPSGGFVGYTGAGSAVTGTYTLGTVTGYNPADVDPSARWIIRAISYDGTHYVTEAIKSTGGTGLPSHLRYCTDITSSSAWGTPTTTQVNTVNMLRYFPGVDYWVSMGPDPTPWYTQDPTGTWTTLATATTQNKLENYAVEYGGGYWVAAGAREESFQQRPSLTYLQASSPASATYTSVGTAGMGVPYVSTNEFWDVAYYGGYFVAVSGDDCELRYANVADAIITKYLRQRQSPRATPQRVTRPALRQRQTFR